MLLEVTVVSHLAVALMALKGREDYTLIERWLKGSLSYDEILTYRHRIAALMNLRPLRER